MRGGLVNFETLPRACSAVATELTFCRTAGGTLGSLCPSTGRRERNGRRRNKRRIVGPWAIAGRERRGPGGHYFAWRALGGVASGLCCRQPRYEGLSKSVL